MQQQSISPDIVEIDGYNRCSVIDNRCSGVSPCWFCKRKMMSKGECSQLCVAREKFSIGIEYKESDIYGNYPTGSITKREEKEPPDKTFGKKITAGLTRKEYLEKMIADANWCKSLYESGVKSGAKISDMTGLSRSVVSSHLSRVGISIKGDVYEKRIETSRECKRLVGDGFGMREIAKKLKISRSTVEIYISEMYEETLSMSKKDRIALCKRLSNDGISTYTIARKIGLNQGTVAIYLSR